MSTLNERLAKAQQIWNATSTASITPEIEGKLFYETNFYKLERDNSNAVYETATENYTKVAVINPTTKKWALEDKGVSEEFVNQAIATAVANLQDNRLEFPTYADFPASGDETKFYVDLSEDKIYIWDSTSSSYKVQSWDTYTISQIQTSLSSAEMAIQNLDQNKQDKLATISGNVGVGKTDASATEKLDINGRIRSNGIVLNEDSSTILPKEIKFQDGDFYGAGNDGIRKKILREGDVSFTGLIQRYVHSSNPMLIPTAVNYAAGTITVPNHGLVINQIYTAGAVPNSFINRAITTTDWAYIPYEWTTGLVRIKPIDANTIQMCNASNAVIAVNPSSAENTGRLDFTKWHVEISSQITLNNFPYGVRRVKMTLLTLLSTASTDKSFKLKLYDSSNSIFLSPNTNPDQNIGNNNSLRFYSGNAVGLVMIGINIEFSAYQGINHVFSNGIATLRSGATSFPTTGIGPINPTWGTRLLNVPECTGIANIYDDFAGLMFNGTIIEIYKN